MPSERRRSSRVEILGRLHGRIVSLDLPVTVREISLVGLSLETTIAFPIGAVHEFRLTLGDGSTVHLSGRIVYCRELGREAGEPTFVCGVEFLEDPAPEGDTVGNIIGRMR